MTFNPNVSKQTQEVVFSRKGITTNHATVYFNNDPVIRENFQKHLGLFLVILMKKLKRPLKVSTELVITSVFPFDNI